MDFLSGDKNTFFQTQFTQRMLLNVSVTDAFPGTAIATAHLRVTVIFFVPYGFLSGVFFTEPSMGQLRASGM
jgi:hypothetical protein